MGRKMSICTLGCRVNQYESMAIADAARARGWKKSDGKPALNPELWDALLQLCETHDVRIHWVKGHAGHPENERCDALAVAQSQKYTKK